MKLVVGKSRGLKEPMIPALRHHGMVCDDKGFVEHWIWEPHQRCWRMACKRSEAELDAMVEDEPWVLRAC